MAKQTNRAAASAANSQDVPEDGLNPDGMVGDGEQKSPPENTPPSSSEEKPAQKKRTARIADRPVCHICGELMHAGSSGAVSTHYYCRDKECPNTAGRQIYRHDRIEYLRRNRSVQQQGVQARDDMRDTDGN